MSKEHLNDYFNSFVKKEEETAIYEHFTKYVEGTAKSILRELLDEAEKLVRLKGDEVLVKGKKVGCIDHSSDKKDGIEFECEKTGKKHKFEDLPKLYAWLAKEHKLDEAETLACLGDKKLAKKSEKDFASFDNDDDLKLSKEKSHEDKVASDDSGSKEHSASEKRKNVAKKQAEKAEKSFRKIDWKD